MLSLAVSGCGKTSKTNTSQGKVPSQYDRIIGPLTPDTNPNVPAANNNSNHGSNNNAGNNNPGSSNPSDPNYNIDNDPSVPTPPIQTRAGAAANGHLYCEFANECHPAVAMISAVAKKGIERCSGFLITPDQVMTNDHCIDSTTAVKENNGNCDGLIFAHFAAVGNSSARDISCKKILYRSFQKGLASKDYAVFQLKERLTDRQPVTPARRGFNDGEDATIYRVQMQSSSGTYDGVQVKSACQATYKTVVYPAVTNPKSPLMTFGDCPIQKGNSGSVALNSDGDAGAIIQGYLTLKDDPTIKDQLRAAMLDDNYGEVGLGTQLACMQEVTRNAGGCSTVLPIQGRYPKDFVEDLGDFDTRSLPRTNSGETWKALPTPGAEQRLFIRAPVCVNPAPSLSFQASVVMYKRGMNHALQAEWRSILKPGDKTAIFQASATAAPSTATMFSSREFGDLEIPACMSRLTQK
ncbi:MAG: trypsin-like peptidase domain-containing protein [Bdellovibrionales bacterium]|nr:trypsin-like peptidase domain-containing protein [Bdellovibrionales bacterium]